MNPAYWILTVVMQGQPLGVYDYYAPVLARFDTQAQCQAEHRKQNDTRRKETQCVKVPAGGQGKPPHPLRPDTAIGPQDPAASAHPELDPATAPKTEPPTDFSKIEAETAKIEKAEKAKAAAKKASAPATK